MVNIFNFWNFQKVYLTQIVIWQSFAGTLEIVVNLELEVACYKKKARQNFKNKVFTYRFTNNWLA